MWRELCLHGAHTIVQVEGVLTGDDHASEVHKQLQQLRDPMPRDQVWSKLFATEPNAWCAYDATARRIDAQLGVSLLESQRDRDAEGVVVAKHLTDILQQPVHPFGVTVARFVEHFEKCYQIEPSDSTRVFEMQLKDAVEDLRQFLLAFKEYICEVLSDCLNTRSRQLHAHAVLLDVVFPMVYEVLWSHYTLVSVYLKNEELTSTGAGHRATGCHTSCKNSLPCWVFVPCNRGSSRFLPGARAISVTQALCESVTPLATDTAGGFTPAEDIDTQQTNTRAEQEC